MEKEGKSYDDEPRPPKACHYACSVEHQNDEIFLKKLRIYTIIIREESWKNHER
jgi:hypothetical protein